MWKFALIHTVDPGEGGTAPQFPLQLFNRPWRSLGQDFDIPVFEVPGHSREPQTAGGPPGEPSVPYPLHQTMNQEPGPSHSVYAFRRRRDQTT